MYAAVNFTSILRTSAGCKSSLIVRAAANFPSKRCGFSTTPYCKFGSVIEDSGGN